MDGLAVPLLARRDRGVVLGALAGVTAVAWLWLWLVGRTAGMEPMEGMPEMLMPMPWSPEVAGLMLAMWCVMMVGMMLPSAAPMIVTFAAVNRSKRARGQDFVPVSIFILGYLAVWAGFSIAATAAQWALDTASLLSPEMAAASPYLGGTLLLASGLYQFTPWKYACLRACRSPLAFLLTRWRDGPGGALRMGVEHGAWCLGCCALLMTLLFAAGVMNLLWVATIALFVLAEKLVPGGVWLSRAGGVTILAMAVWIVWP